LLLLGVVIRYEEPPPRARGSLARGPGYYATSVFAQIQFPTPESQARLGADGPKAAPLNSQILVWLFG